MKRLFLLLVVLGLLVSLTACQGRGAQKSPDEPAQTQPAEQNQSSSSEKEESSAEPKEEGSAPSAEAFVTGYFKPIAEIQPGSAGSSLKMAKAVCAAVTFASENKLKDAGEKALKEQILAAWNSLEESEQKAFDECFLDVVGRVSSCAEDWSASKGTFEDAGVADQMQALLEDPDAIESWERLVGFTLTMGNSED